MNYLSHKEIQSELFDLLCVFDAFVTEHGLRYSLDAGTLLGAARHEGFIPWDDDVDVMMPRPDYERLLTLAAEVPEGYELSSFKTSGMAFPFVKFSNLGIRMQEEFTGDSFEEYLWIDVFPIDGMHENERDLAVYQRIRKLMQDKIFRSYPSAVGWLNIVKKPIQAAMKAYKPVSKIMEEMDALAQEVPFGNSKWCRDIVWANNPDARMRTSDFDNLGTLEFEGRAFPVIDNWSDYLTSQYGDYMQLPPIEQQVTHDAKAWRL